MKPIICVILAIIIAGMMTAVAVMVPAQTPAPDTPPEPTIYYQAGTEIIDRRYTPPDTYEIRYRTTFENGLTVTIWREVSREEYEKYKEI